FFFFFSSRRRHTRSYGDWSSDVCSSDLGKLKFESRGGPSMRPSKPVSSSKSIISTQMLPSDANPMGNVHGGTILKQVDVAAGVTALRHTRMNIVTASIDRMDFYNPVYVGNLLTLKASVN